MSKHLSSRRQSSPTSSTNMDLMNDENNKILDFEQLFESIKLSSESQKDTAACIVKSG